MLYALEWSGMLGLHGRADSAQPSLHVYAGKATPIHLYKNLMHARYGDAAGQAMCLLCRHRPHQL